MSAVHLAPHVLSISVSVRLPSATRSLPHRFVHVLTEAQAPEHEHASDVPQWVKEHETLGFLSFLLHLGGSEVLSVRQQEDNLYVFLCVDCLCSKEMIWITTRRSRCLSIGQHADMIRDPFFVSLGLHVCTRH